MWTCAPETRMVSRHAYGTVRLLIGVMPMVATDIKEYFNSGNVYRTQNTGRGFRA